ncbi:MAG: ABC transporter substrate-binding protein [Candidatus Daviesbacteria bacterium GW2011_GWA1_41_61]|uniref:ABC transporter substrate-binding protein n=1 Tax=Candidatus Daviesbacteria bacterium GW2011_GWA2_40_9 TaxID=1618424 RepID=A0A0G0U663_9BACT|nr:MAG: hypothetical protein UU26_C0004G0021 [Candidatus Daviesbacteria bacterium GW2011_GWC1_40_9]KKR82656.1 MAG: ABC transporter substrate-binding protein [Candidatus Daviesbacteria bacterium GW2011_GWA2_40_9]KKR93389.1 MAG: ABC transporter substrate-binding protein [Candidatus Daviesbacteria bacterium GW2011_GWB1_41_15]KKS15062.1 MAG: ABC transporter substrate-binding protein [Candidatus Daviesbacteria bacterium GW2011_GWA1_41_61]
MKILILLIVIVVLGIVGWFAYGSVSTKPTTQITAKPKVIGTIYFRPQHTDALEGFKEGMRKLGYTNKDITYDDVVILAGPKMEEDVNKAVQKLIADKVDILFVSFESSAKVALDVTKKSGSDLPIVFTTRFHDPLNYGLIESYKSSGNNATGVATNLTQSIQKTLLFFKEINPKAKRIAAFTDGFMIPGISDAILKELKDQAPRFGLSIVEYKTQKPPSLAKENWVEVADKIKLGDIDGLIHLPGHFYDSDDHGEGKSQEADETLLANRLHIPFVVPSEDLSSGGSFAFSDDFHASAGQAAVMVQKILNGIKPKDIPIEYGSKSLLILNLNRAREAGIQFPESMLSIANIKIDK